MAETTISSEARKHVQRGRLRKPAPDRVTAEISDTPPASSPAGTPPIVTPPGPVDVHWGKLGEQFGVVVGPFYDSLGAARPDPTLWQGFGLAWGQVIEYYVPSFRSGPIPAAVVMTTFVALPLIVAYPAWKQKQRDEAAKKAAAAAPREELRAA